MSYDLVVRGGTIVTAADSFEADIGVRAGRIAEIGDGLPRGEQDVDAHGLLVLPGGIDVHTHLDIELAGMRSADDFESGTAAAACGGVTTICDYAWQEKGWSLARTVEAWKVRAQDRAHVDYAFHIVVNDVLLHDLLSEAKCVRQGVVAPPKSARGSSLSAPGPRALTLPFWERMRALFPWRLVFAQRTAMGLPGEPVAPFSGTGTKM